MSDDRGRREDRRRLIRDIAVVGALGIGVAIIGVVALGVIITVMFGQ